MSVSGALLAGFGRFFAVYGVRPRSFPGVLNTLKMLLDSVSIDTHNEARVDLHVSRRKDLGHVFVQPVHFIPYRERELLDFLRDHVIDLTLLRHDPWCRPNR